MILQVAPEKPKTARQLEYQAYLQTDHWKNLSRQCKERDGMKCVRCGNHSPLHSHHRFYRQHWTDTLLSDLTTLCETCHGKEHGLVKAAIVPPAPVASGVRITDWRSLRHARGQRLISREEYLRLKRIRPRQKKKKHRRHGQPNNKGKRKENRVRAALLNQRESRRYRYQWTC